ncbi:hypothetical protein BGX28_007814 [Mortierella sp. GBA30]|nr:hypothetical protein BGX28_007814 [Mortierella sp. GBA30]
MDQTFGLPTECPECQAYFHRGHQQCQQQPPGHYFLACGHIVVVSNPSMVSPIQLRQEYITTDNEAALAALYISTVNQQQTGSGEINNGVVLGSYPGHTTCSSLMSVVTGRSGIGQRANLSANPAVAPLQYHLPIPSAVTPSQSISQLISSQLSQQPHYEDACRVETPDYGTILQRVSSQPLPVPDNHEIFQDCDINFLGNRASSTFSVNVVNESEMRPAQEQVAAPQAAPSAADSGFFELARQYNMEHFRSSARETSATITQGDAHMQASET